MRGVAHQGCEGLGVEVYEPAVLQPVIEHLVLADPEQVAPGVVLLGRLHQVAGVQLVAVVGPGAPVRQAGLQGAGDTGGRW